LNSSPSLSRKRWLADAVTDNVVHIEIARTDIVYDQIGLKRYFVFDTNRLSGYLRRHMAAIAEEWVLLLLIG
jgi:hypothetical protein